MMRARAWWLERRFPKRWRETKDNTEPRDALKLPQSGESRDKRTNKMLSQPSPELIEAFRRNGYDIVKRPALPTITASGEAQKETTSEANQAGPVAGNEGDQGNKTKA